MGMRALMREMAIRALASNGYEVVPKPMTYEWQRRQPESRSGAPAVSISDEYLQPDNPRLKALERSYRLFGGPAAIPDVWRPDYITPDQLRSFRGENGYVWQGRLRNDNPLGYALSYYYAEAHDKLGLLNKLTEDEAFGVLLFNASRRLISRDLLDSVIELNFLERVLSISSKAGMTVLDIGAGYGRLAHRAVSAFDNLSAYLCADAVAVSTFICERYLAYRKLFGRAQAVALDKIEETIARRKIDLAVNIHSWPECHPEAVRWWIALLARARVPHIFVVTNELPAGTPLCTNRGEDLSGIMKDMGYTLSLRAPKYEDPVVQSYGIHPATYFLWRLETRGR